MLITTTRSGHDLREARRRVGITRARLADLADCSIASLDRIEQGAVPKRSRVLERAWMAIERAENKNGPAGNQSVPTTMSGDGARDEAYTE